MFSSDSKHKGTIRFFMLYALHGQAGDELQDIFQTIHPLSEKGMCITTSEYRAWNLCAFGFKTEWKKIERRVRWAWGKYIFKVGFPTEELLETFVPWYREFVTK